MPAVPTFALAGGPPSPSEALAALSEMLRPVEPRSWSARWYRRFGKRLVDVVGSAFLIAATAPVMALVSIVVWRRHGHPVLFTQPRLGAGAAEFRMYKFRTMQPDRRSAADGPEPATERRDPVPSTNDPRLTSLGRRLSELGLDELPQLFHVLRGEMSLVGPRPDYPHRLDAYVGLERRRFDAAPGMTGPWQVLVGTTADLHQYVDLDLMYLERCSFRNDVALLLATPGASGRRASARS